MAWRAAYATLVLWSSDFCEVASENARSHWSYHGVARHGLSHDLAHPAPVQPLPPPPLPPPLPAPLPPRHRGEAPPMPPRDEEEAGASAPPLFASTLHSFCGTTWVASVWPGAKTAQVEVTSGRVYAPGRRTAAGSPTSSPAGGAPALLAEIESAWQTPRHKMPFNTSKEVENVRR
jgi:hypothetical protein